MSTVFLCGMPEEKNVILKVLPGARVLMGQDKLNLPTLVPADCNRIISCGLFGGLAPGIPVGGICIANAVTDKAGQIYDCDHVWNGKVAQAAYSAKMNLAATSWFSSGLMDTADTTPQRAALYAKYHCRAIDDETRYAIGFVQQMAIIRRTIQVNVLRSCSDDFSETLPLAARGAIMNADGSANLSYLLKTLATEPLYQDVDLFKVATDAYYSLSTLEYTLRKIPQEILLS